MTGKNNRLFGRHFETVQHFQYFLYGIYARDERHAINLVSWIEVLIFIRGVIIQMKPMK